MPRLEDSLIQDFGETVEPKGQILSDENAEKLVVTLTIMMTKILADFPDELPDVLFPETTGRLLEQPVLTILTAAAKQRNVTIPEGYHFVTASGGTNQYLRRYEEVVEEAKAVNLSPKEYLQKGQIPSPDDLRFARISSDHVQALKNKQEAAAQSLQIQRADAGRNNALIMVDDTISLHASAIKQIRNAFHDENMNGYALFGAFQKKLSNQMLQNTFVASHSRNNIGGLGSPFWSMGGSRRQLAIGVMKSVEPMDVAIFPYTEKDSKPFQEAFQREMTQITMQVAQNLHLLLTV